MKVRTQSMHAQELPPKETPDRWSRFIIASLIHRPWVLMLILLSGWTLLPACQSAVVDAAVSCEDIDWFELGRQDGTQGLSWDRFLTYKQECTDASGTSNNTLYSAGHRAGLVDYCSWKNGIELGPTLQQVPEICPMIYRKRMALAIQLGQQLDRLQNENQELDLQLNRHRSLLSSNKLDSRQQSQIRKEINQLKSKQAITSQRLKDLEGKANTQVF